MRILNRNNQTEFHVITCDHEFFIDAGLGSFTFPQILKWWGQTNFKGEYVNQTLFRDPQFDDPTTYLDISALLGYSDDYRYNYDSFIIDAWRFEGYNKGSYQPYNMYDFADITAFPEREAGPWVYYNKNPDAETAELGDYTYEDINLPQYDNKYFDRGSRTLKDAVIEKYNRETRRFETTKVELPPPISNYIAMNDRFNILGYEENAEDQAVKRFLRDVRRAKGGGCIPWRRELIMFVPVSEGGPICPTEESFNFKLYLFDKKRPLNTEKTQAFPSLNIAAPAVGADGVNNLDKVDGESNAITDDSPNNKVAGKLRTSYRSYDGAFSAGSEVRLAIVSSDSIPGASFPSDAANWAENMDIKLHLRDSVANQHMTPGNGEVIPIDMQNGNPYQWTPNYSEPVGCRGDNKDKVTLKVFNFNPKSFNRGDIVEIVDEYSLWFVKELAEVEPVFIPKEVSEWQFTYHITNQRFHFRKADYHKEGSGDEGLFENDRVISEFGMEEELAERNLFAKSVELWTAGHLVDSLANKLDKGAAWPGYAQVTSFDYLGKEFGGMRGVDGNAILLTDNRVDHEGIAIEGFDDLTKEAGGFTTPFFGCVFSEGFADNGKYADLNSPIFDEENPELLTGKGWRPGANTKNSAGSSLSQDDSFFDLSQFIGGPYGSGGDGFTPEGNTLVGGEEKFGVFDPRAVHNNKSTNKAAVGSNENGLGFLGNDQISKLNEDNGHVNLFSSEALFRHLPADVATNGSWSAVNGGPILNLNKVQQYITNPKVLSYYDDTFNPNNQENRLASPDKIADSFHDFWLDPASYQWLHDTIDREQRSTYTDTDRSILDLSPKNINKVLFKPLKDAVYCQWDTMENGIPKPASFMGEYGFIVPGYNSASPSQRVGISYYGGAKHMFNEKTRTRIFNKDQQDGNHHLIVDETDQVVSDYGAPGNINIMPFEYSLYYGNSHMLGYAEHIDEGYAVELRNSIYYQSNTADQNGASIIQGNERISMGGFGVIGARCTTQVTQGIQFNTSNYLGHRFLAVQPPIFDAMWGARTQLKWYQSNTTQLFVKAYQAWPRDQTIFDSRFFAVHHFNEGNRFPIGLNGLRPWDIGYRSGDTVTKQLWADADQAEVTYDPLTQEATGITVTHIEGDQRYSNRFSYQIDKQATNVDAKIPSYYEEFTFIPENSVGLPPVEFKVSDNDLSLVFKEGVVTGEKSRNHRVISNDEVVSHDTYIMDNYEEKDWDVYSDLYADYTPVAPKAQWVVDPDRRGRLLPWYQDQLTIGFGPIEFMTVPTSTPEGLEAPDGTPFTEEAENAWNKRTLLNVCSHESLGGNVIVSNSGIGYKVSDKFNVQGGDGSSAEAIVTSVGPSGEVLDLAWNSSDVQLVSDYVVPITYNGKDYSHDDFPAGTQSGITTSSRSNLSFVPVSGDNRSFKAYIMCGELTTTTNIDFKPQIASVLKEAYQLGADNQTLETAGSEATRTDHDFTVIPFGATPIAFGGPATTTQTKAQLSTDPLSVDKESTMEIDLTPENTNPNVISGRVDLFFQFHNDISHTKHSLAPNGQSAENFIDLSVTPY